jgi:probable HAF family extracellular repeat protein
MKMSKLTFAALLLLATVPLALAQGTYTQIDYPGSTSTYCWGINDAGDISGGYDDTSSLVHGFLLSGGSYTAINYPSAYFTAATGINNVGQIVGQYSRNSGSPVSGFLYDVQTQAFSVVTFPGASNTWPVAISDAGGVVGSFFPQGGSLAQGFELAGTTYRSIAPPAAVFTLVFGITASGELAGYVDLGGNFFNFSFNRGKYRSINIPGAFDYYGEGTNATGNAIVGSYAPSSTEAGFLFQNKVLTTLQFPGADGTWAYGVNDSGEVVGAFIDTRGIRHGFTWTPPADAGKK